MIGARDISEDLTLFSVWKIWVNARTEAKARILLSRVLKKMHCTAEVRWIEPYPKIDGFVVCFSIPVESQRWNDAIVETIERGQRFAHGWDLDGSIYENPEAASNRTSISGVVMAEWRLLSEPQLRVLRGGLADQFQ
ncbi:MAG TPA: hypothetical protein VGM86_19510 [Thermoanaerobaculia bacterium]|jgi:hypothetical protein